jgi:hypothetical protein
VAQTVTLEVPEPVVESARAIATLTNRRVEDVLVDWLDRAATELPVEQLSDAQVLALRDLQMGESEQAELDALLAAQREGALADADRHRLDSLMAHYRRGLVRKAQALKVAAERGLQPPLG